MINSTLCYIEKDGCWLMLHRVKKRNDANHDKWIGVGGKCEDGESPDECVLREVREETGLTLTDWRYRGLVHFVSDQWPSEEMHLYTATGWTGELIRGEDCAEGVLEWVPMQQADQLPIWEGDKVFLRLLREGAPLFELTLRYHGESLAAVELDGAPQLGQINRRPIRQIDPARLTVRYAQEWDLSAMNELALQRWRRKARRADRHEPGGGVSTPPDFVAGWCRVLRQPNCGILLAEYDRQLMGWAVLQTVGGQPPCLLINDLWLAEAAQDADTDLLLLRRAARHAANRGLKDLRYWVNSGDKAALQRYEALGARRGGVQGMMYSCNQELVWPDPAALADR